MSSSHFIKFVDYMDITEPAGPQIIEFMNQNPVQLQLQQVEDFIKQVLPLLVPPSSKFFGLPLKSISKLLPKAVCGKRLNRENSVRCQTCSFDSSSILCLDCFDPNDHIGHKYDFIIGQGMCDCGFAYTIKRSGFCKRHYGHDIVIDIVGQSYQDFNPEMIMMLSMYLFGLIGCYVTKRIDSVSCQTVIQILERIYYSSPTDLFLLMNTKVLFRDIRKESVVSLMENSTDLRKTYLKFFDIQNVLQKLKFELFFDSPVIMTMLYSQSLVDDQSTFDINQLLMNHQIPEPSFRMLLMNSYYMKATDTVFRVCNNQKYKSLFFGKEDNFSILPKISDVQDIKIALAKEIWSEGPTQLDSNIQLDDIVAYFHNFIELSSFYFCQSVIFPNLVRTTSSQYINELKHFVYELFERSKQSMIDQIYESELYSQNINDRKQMLSFFDSNYDIKYKQLLEIFLNFYPCLDLSSTSAKQQSRLALSVIYSAFPQIYSLKNLFFCSQLYKNISSSFILLAILDQRRVQIFRIRDRPIIEYEQDLKQALSFNYQSLDCFSNFAYGSFLAMLFSQNIDHKQFGIEEDLARVSHDYARVPLVISSNIRIKINNIMQSSLFFILYHQVNKLNLMKIKDGVPYGYGIHTVNSVVQSDEKIDGQHEQMYVICDPLVEFLGFASQAYQMHQQNIRQLMDEQLSTIPVIQGVNKKALLTNYLCQILASYSMVQSSMFLKLAENTQRVLSIFANYNNRGMFENTMQLICYLLQVLVSNELPALIVFRILADNFGIYNFETNQFEYNKLESREKMNAMLQYFVLFCVSVFGKDQSYINVNDYALQKILGLAFRSEKLSLSDMDTYFSSFDGYNAEKFQQHYKTVGDLSAGGAQISNPYTSACQESTFILNSNGKRQFSIFNPNFTLDGNIIPFLSQTDLKLPELTVTNTFFANIFQDMKDDAFVFEVFQQCILTLKENAVIAKNSVQKQLFPLLFVKLYLDINPKILLKMQPKMVTQLQQVVQYQRLHLANTCVMELIEMIANTLFKKVEAKEKKSLYAKLKLIKEKLPPAYSNNLQITETNVPIEIPVNTPDLNSNQHNFEGYQFFVSCLKKIEQFIRPCPICQGFDADSHFSLQYYVRKSQFCQDNLSEQVFMLGCCKHLVHYNCSQKSRSQCCSVCRSYFHFQLPLLTKISANWFHQILLAATNVQCLCDENQNFIILEDLIDWDQMVFKDKINEITVKQYGLQSSVDHQILAQLFLKNVSDIFSFLCLSNLKYKVFQLKRIEFNSPTESKKYYEVLILQLIPIFTNYIYLIVLNQILTYQQNITQEEALNLIIQSFYGQLKDELCLTILHDIDTLIRSILQPVTIVNFDSCSQQILCSDSRYLLQEFDDEAVFQQVYPLALLFENIQQLQLPAFDHVDRPQLFKTIFDNSWMTLLARLSKIPCKHCQKCSQQPLICLSCGDVFCYECFSKVGEDHIDECNKIGVFYCVQQNYLFLTEFVEHVYFTGGPYLDSNYEDDVGRNKKIPLNLNQTLLTSLYRQLVADDFYSTYFGHQNGVSRDRLMEILPTFSRQVDD